MAIVRIKPSSRLSQAVVFNGLVFFAGQVAFQNVTGTTAEQMREILAKIEGLLQEAGIAKADLIKVAVYLLDMGDFELMNEIWEAWIDPTAPPARITLKSAFAHPEMRIEIDAIAGLPTTEV